MYPLLGIKKGGSVTPIETYLSWEGMYSPKDRRLICLYHIRNDREFVNFEKAYLRGNKLFETYFEVEECEQGRRGVYVFNFEPFKTDWDNIISGKYSKLSDKLKKKIAEFFSKSSGNYTYIESYLYPERFYEIYSIMLFHTPKDQEKGRRLLQEVGELCSLPDFEKEKLRVEVRNLDMSNILP